MGKIRVGAVSYLNTKPLLYGIVRSEALQERIDLITDYPANIAQKLVKGEIDLGLVPVAIIPQLQEWHILSDFCIGAEGEVASVCMFSEVPLHQIQRVLLDYQSRTSVNLCRILLQHHWKINPALEQGDLDFRSQIKGSTAGVVIGDRALEQRAVSPFIYDLAEGWKQLTGLPFVFAAWIANKPLPEAFLQQFNDANRVGLQQLDKVIGENPYEAYDLGQYYRKNISYCLTADKRKGLELFLEMLQQL